MTRLGSAKVNILKAYFSKWIQKFCTTENQTVQWTLTQHVNSVVALHPCLNAEWIYSPTSTLHPHLCIAVSSSVQCAVISMPALFATCGPLALDRHADTWEMSHKQINLLRSKREPKIQMCPIQTQRLSTNPFPNTTKHNAIPMNVIVQIVINNVFFKNLVMFWNLKRNTYWWFGFLPDWQTEHMDSFSKVFFFLDTAALLWSFLEIQNLCTETVHSMHRCSTFWGCSCCIELHLMCSCWCYCAQF